MSRLFYPGERWFVDLTDDQLAAGVAANGRQDATHWKVWKALKEAGVPVRDEAGRTVASLAATVIQARCMR